MAIIVEQQQDLFFEFDIDLPEKIIDIAQRKQDIFLIGCFKKEQKCQIDSMLHKVESGTFERYNIRLGKGYGGWILKLLILIM